MYLLFDGVSSHGYIGVFNSERLCFGEENFYIQWNESTKTIPVIDNFLKTNNIWYQNISNIIVVIGPGSFTGIRTISLVVNTLAYIFPHIRLTAISFFDLYAHYPILKSSSKRDLFVKYSKSATIEIVKNEDFYVSSDTKNIYWDVDIEKLTERYTLKNTPDYHTLVQNLNLRDDKRVAPTYIKKPNIS